MVQESLKVCRSLDNFSTKYRRTHLVAMVFQRSHDGTGPTSAEIGKAFKRVKRHALIIDAAVYQ
jgi:hypothetical protein